MRMYAVTDSPVSRSPEGKDPEEQRTSQESRGGEQDGEEHAQPRARADHAPGLLRRLRRVHGDELRERQADSEVEIGQVAGDGGEQNPDSETLGAEAVKQERRCGEREEKSPDARDDSILDVRQQRAFGSGR